MQQMGNLDYYYLVRELAAAEGAHLEQAYSLAPGLFRFKLKGAAFSGDLLAELGVRCHLSVKLQDAPKQPSSFAMLLRKHYCGKRVAKIEQLHFDRLLRLDFGEAGSIVIEMFKGGNLLALDASGKILMPYRSEDYAARTLRRGELYAEPPQTQKHPSQASGEDVSGGVKVVSALSKKISLPPFYFEEACRRAGVGLDEKADDLGEGEKTRLVQAIRSLLAQTPSPRVYFENDAPFAFSPFALQKTGDALSEVFPSFSAALEHYYALAPRIGAKSKDRAAAALAKQEEAVQQFAAKAAEARAAAAWISDNAELVDELIAVARNKGGYRIAAAAAEHGLKARIEGVKLVLEK